MPQPSPIVKEILSSRLIFERLYSTVISFSEGLDTSTSSKEGVTLCATPSFIAMNALYGGE